MVFTLGGDGAFYAHQDGTRFKSPAYDIKVVDTIGCGDAFDAGFITALHHKMDLETSLRFAQAAAGLVATGLGSDAGIRSFDHTLEVMKAWKVKRKILSPRRKSGPIKFRPRDQRRPLDPIQGVPAFRWDDGT